MIVSDEEIRTRMMKLPRSVLAAMLRIGRRITEGFDGEILISVKRGGVSFIRWSQTETGDVIKEELE